MHEIIIILKYYVEARDKDYVSLPLHAAYGG